MGKIVGVPYPQSYLKSLTRDEVFKHPLTYFDCRPLQVGLHISDVLRNNLAELTAAVGWAPDNLIIDRFGLNLDFIEAQNLTWIDGLATGSGKDLSDLHHPDHTAPYIQRYLRDYGARKVEANAMVVRPEPSRALLRDTILKYLSAEAPMYYLATLAPQCDQVRDEVLHLLKARTPGNENKN